MSSFLRINNFIDAANQASLSSSKKCLTAHTSDLSVRLADITWSTSAADRNRNKATWQIFKESLIGTVGISKFEWICQRYRSQINFTRMEKSGKPLLPEHVELFSIGAAQLLGRDIKAHLHHGKLKDLTREQIKEKSRLVQPFPVMGHYTDPVHIAGSPSSILAYFFHDKLLMDKEKQLLFSDAERISFQAWQERMSKVSINRELIEGQVIPAPGQDGRIDYYKVYRKIATGDGLVAYALKPAARDSTLKPMILFRPSQWAFSNEDAFETYLNDVQKNVGEMGWRTAAHHFRQLMQDRHFRPNNDKISISGFSLGGAHAQQFLEDHCQNVGHAVFYGDPSVDHDTAVRIRDKMNAMPRRSEPLNMQIFRMKGDFCHYVGDKHAGWGVTHPDVNIQLMEIDHDNKKVTGFYLHSHRIFDNTVFPYQMQRYENPEELNKHLDNAERGADVLWYERMRTIWGQVAFYSLFSLSELVKLVSWMFGVKVLRKSNDPF